MKLDPAVRELLDDRRLAADASSRRRGFTLSRTRALLSWRERSGVHWAVHLARAANVLGDRSAGIVRGIDRGVEVEIVHPGFVLEGVELGDILLSALAPDRGPTPTAERDELVARWRECIGRTINAALGTGPQTVEVITPSGGRRYERREAAGEGVDPYALRVTGRCEGREHFVVRVVERADLGSRMRAWFADDHLEAIHEAWRRAVVGADEAEAEEGSPFSLTPVAPGAPVDLGGHARFGHATSLRGPWLLRDGVRILDLRATLVEAGISDPPSGWVECGSLSLAADDRSVVRDAAFERLVAWLFDMVAHTYDGAGPQPSVIWPDDVASVRTASGRVEGVDVLRRRSATGREVVFVWPHEAAKITGRARALVYAIWPSELRVLREQMADVRFVPASALGGDDDLARLDLTPLREGSLPPVDLGSGSVTTSAGTIEAEVEVYVHRYPGATLGSVVVLAFGRALVQTRDRARVVGGVTTIVRVRTDGVDPVDTDTLRDDDDALGELVNLGRERVEASTPALTAAVLERADVPLENPYLRARLAALDARAIRLRYVTTDAGVRLEWDEHPLLRLPVASEADGRRVSLATVLDRLRDVGFVVLGDERRRFPSLESETEALSTVWLSADASAWVGAVLDPECTVTMPATPEANPRVRPAADQRVLVNDRAVEDDMAVARTSLPARTRLVGRALIRRALGAPSPALDRLRFVHRYDPRALRPSAHVSLAAVAEAEPRPELVPPGTVGRDLAGPVLAVPPALASLLHEVFGLEPARARRAGETGPAARPTPRRRRAAPREPLLVRTVEHELAIGTLSISGDGNSDGVTIWSRGLRVGALDLPEPLGRVSGRLWLTPKGRLARADTLGTVVRELARTMLLDAPRQRSLLPSSDRRRDALGTLVAYVGRVVEGDGDRFGLGELRGAAAEPSFERALDASLRRAPIGRAKTLDQLVRGCLGRRVPIERAILSWSPGKLMDRRTVEIGNRHAWVRRADDSPDAALRAAWAVLDGVLRDDKWGREISETPTERRERAAWVMRSMWRWMAYVAQR